MARSLFLFDMTFWLYLASLTLYIAYLFARRPAMAFAPAGLPAEDFDERYGALATPLGQVATLVKVFGWFLGCLYNVLLVRSGAWTLVPASDNWLHFLSFSFISDRYFFLYFYLLI